MAIVFYGRFTPSFRSPFCNMSATIVMILLAVIVSARATTPFAINDNATTRQYQTTSSSYGDSDRGNVSCRLTTTDPFIHNKVHHLLTVDAATLINYELHFTNYWRNPLSINMAGVYEANKWSRVTTAHGQTLLSLAFNYGVLSMKTLTLGTEKLPVELRDWPHGCFGELVTDQQKV